MVILREKNKNEWNNEVQIVATDMRKWKFDQKVSSRALSPFLLMTLMLWFCRFLIGCYGSDESKGTYYRFGVIGSIWRERALSRMFGRWIGDVERRWIFHSTVLYIVHLPDYE